MGSPGLLSGREMKLKLRLLYLGGGVQVTPRALPAARSGCTTKR